jgi:molybdate transport system substrate-binding protein
MATSMTRIAFGIAAAIVLFPKESAATEIKALITIGVQSAIDELAPRFEKSSGHKLAITYGLGAPLGKRIQDGEVADLLISTRETVDSLLKSGKIAAGTDATLASSGIGIAVRKGAAKPDISSPDALKTALLAAKSVGYGNPAAGGGAGVHFAKVLERLGIADAVKSKAKFPAPGTYVGTMLVNGEVELGIQQIPELAFVNGVEVVGPLPGDLQAVTVFAVGVPTVAKEAGAAKAFINFLRSAEALAVIKAKGLDPR